MTLSRRTRAQVFLRGLFLQAGYNPEGQQSLGLTYALLPGIKALYQDPHVRAEAIRRYLSTTFNTHPYLASAILGGILHHEERISKGNADPSIAERFKSTLQGPLAAIGDGFFWLSLAPATGAVCAAASFAISGWAAVLYLVLFNVVHLTARAQFFAWGCALGDQMLAKFASANFAPWGGRLRTVAAFFAGAVALQAGITFGQREAPIFWSWVVASAILPAGAFFASKRPHARLWLLYGSALLAMLLGALQ